MYRKRCSSETSCRGKGRTQKDVAASRGVVATPTNFLRVNTKLGCGGVAGLGARSRAASRTRRTRRPTGVLGARTPRRFLPPPRVGNEGGGGGALLDVRLRMEPPRRRPARACAPRTLVLDSPSDTSPPSSPTTHFFGVCLVDTARSLLPNFRKTWQHRHRTSSRLL